MNPIPIALTAAVVAVAVTAVEGAIGVGRAVLDGASAPDPAA